MRNHPDAKSALSIATDSTSLNMHAGNIMKIPSKQHSRRNSILQQSVYSNKSRKLSIGAKQISDEN